MSLTLQAILQELERRKPKFKDWYKFGHEKQRQFIEDPSRFKAALCTRRAGKSFGVGLYAFKTAFENPGCSVVILGLTRESVKKIFVKDIIEPINAEFELDGIFNKSELHLTLPNRSVIYLLGVDANPDDMNKLLGQKNKLVIIDEAAFFRQDLKRLVYEILMPTMIDCDGTIVLVSTTSHLTTGLFYDITTGKVPKWSVHQWSAKDNPALKGKWDKMIAELKEQNPNIEETPFFRRMYLNEWVIDTDTLVYKYKAERNCIPKEPKQRYRYVMGIDLGYNDDTAIVICAYNNHDPNLYVVDCFKKKGMIVHDVALKIKEFQNLYEIDSYITDPASKQVVEEIRQRHGIPLEAAEKLHKYDAIELFNSDIITGYVKITEKAQAVIEEWKHLTWDERKLEKGIHVEHPSCPNHLSDALLYAFRYVYNFCSKPKEAWLDPRSAEAEEISFQKRIEPKQIDNDWLTVPTDEE